MNTVDMSEHAITTRIRRVSQLRRLCLSLRKAKPIPVKTENPEAAAPPKAAPRE